MAEENAEDPLMPRVQVGRHRKLAHAREAALVLAAKDIPYWIERTGNDWEILVEEDIEEFAKAELGAVAAESRERLPQVHAHEKLRTLPLFVCVWMLGGFFFLQQVLGEKWTERGAAVSDRIVHGEWWRTVTALTLHADLPHLVANLLTGLLFAAFLQPLLGNGLALVLIILSGVLGNIANALSYGSAQHASIGASTAVFGALGILVGIELMARLREPHTRNRWSLIVPVGAGLALLAFLGVGERTDRVDIMAHLWGLISGLPLGVTAEAARLKQLFPRHTQIGLGVIALVAPLAAWAYALHGTSLAIGTSH